jgi:hypothetical protein
MQDVNPGKVRDGAIQQDAIIAGRMYMVGNLRDIRGKVTEVPFPPEILKQAPRAPPLFLYNKEFQ